jgi:ABC-type glycerol-3-phosphate transport system substrate-binding protein
MVGCAGLLVALVGCSGSGEGAAAPSEVERVEATASMDPNSITVLVTFVGGPADGWTEHRPLVEATGEVTIDGVTYRGNPGPPPEVKDTAEGLAQVMRPV